MKYTINANNKPPTPSHARGWTRGLSPWHRDAFPAELANQAPEQGERISGWYLEDTWGNEIGFVADGTEINVDECSLDYEQARERAEGKAK